MYRSEFMQLEYQTLREEIAATKHRNFQVMGLGIAGIPAATYLVEYLNLGYFALGVPILVIVVALQYLANNHNIMRCGRYINKYLEMYIRDDLEPPADRRPIIGGWEEWLESKDACNPRRTERYLFFAIQLLFLAYYLVSSALAWQFATAQLPDPVPQAVLGIYSGVGMWFGLHLVGELRATTKLRDEVSYFDTHGEVGKGRSLGIETIFRVDSTDTGQRP